MGMVLSILVASLCLLPRLRLVGRSNSVVALVPWVAVVMLVVELIRHLSPSRCYVRPKHSHLWWWTAHLLLQHRLWYHHERDRVTQ